MKKTQFFIDSDLTFSKKRLHEKDLEIKSLIIHSVFTKAIILYITTRYSQNTTH